MRIEAECFSELGERSFLDSLYDEQWVLAYEANIRGWLPMAEDYVENDENFRRLKKADITFLVLDDDELPEEQDWDPYGASEYEEEDHHFHFGYSENELTRDF